MNLDDRLRGLAAHIDTELGHPTRDGDRFEPVPRRSGDPGIRVLPAGRGGRRSRTAVLAAAAAVAVVGVGGLAVASWVRDSTPASGSGGVNSAASLSAPDVPPGAAERPRYPTAYPAVDEPIEGSSDAVGSYSMRDMENPMRVDALIGVVSDTELDGGIHVQAVAGTRADAQAVLAPASTQVPDGATATTVGSLSGSVATVMPGGTSDTVEVFGRQADVYAEPGTPRLFTVVLDSDVEGVTMRFTGLEPLAVLTNNDQFVDVVARPAVDDSARPPFTLEFAADLPDGYEVVVEPFVVPNASVMGSLSVNNVPGVEGHLIEVSTFDRLADVAAAGSLTAVDVNGTSGWMSNERGHAVLWHVNDETFALVGGSATVDEAVAVANSVSFIDEATWRERYDVDEPDFVSIIATASDAVEPSIPEPSLAAEPTTTVAGPAGTDS
ncbi:hypothetical protein BH24ACT5_BH24ACT5_10250 [soil metagenome]